MSPLGMAALLLATILATATLWRLNEPAVRTTVTLIDKARFVIGSIFLTLLLYHYLRSGDPIRIFGALLGLAFLTGYLLVEQPWKEVI